MLQNGYFVTVMTFLNCSLKHNTVSPINNIAFVNHSRYRQFFFKAFDVRVAWNRKLQAESCQLGQWYFLVIIRSPPLAACILPCEAAGSNASTILHCASRRTIPMPRAPNGLRFCRQTDRGTDAEWRDSVCR